MLTPSLIAYLDDEPVITIKMFAEMEDVRLGVVYEVFMGMRRTLVKSQDYVFLSWKDRHLVRFLVTSPGRVSPASKHLIRKYLPPETADICLLTRSGHQILREGIQQYTTPRRPCIHRRPRKTGYIYVIQEWLTGHIKIGVSNNPIRRIKGIQTGNSSKLQILDTIEVCDPYNVEKSIHHELSEHRIRGEWFAPEVKSMVRDIVGKAACQTSVIN